MAYKRGAREAMANPQPLPQRHLEPNINTGKPWSQTDVDDLLAAFRSDADLEEIAEHLCRDWEEVAQKCAELKLDLRYQLSKRAGKEQVRKKRRDYWEQEHGRRLAVWLAGDDRSSEEG